MPVEDGEPVADGAERGHECRRDGDARNDRAPFLAGGLEHAGNAAEQRYQHVVDRGVGPCEKFRGILEGKRAEDEEKGGGRDADGHHYAEVLQRILHKPVVLDAQSEAETEDRPHHRRDEHGADDDRYRIHIQPHGGYDDSAGEDEDIRPPECDVLPYGQTCIAVVYVFRHVDMILEVFRKLSHKSVCFNYCAIVMRNNLTCLC